MNLYGRRDMKKSFVIALVTVALLTAAGVALAGTGAEAHTSAGALLRDFLYRCFNFAITFALLAYFLVKPIRNALAGRREGIAKRLEEAERARQQAEAKFAEYDDKLSQAEAEIEKIYEAIKREGEAERDRILANAQDMAVKIRQDAEKTATHEVARARDALRREAAELAVNIAEDILTKNLTAGDQTRLVEEYVQKVGELH
jgi:F-type H+-transporting ATPase subunit b